MVRRHQRLAGACQLESADLDLSFVINVIEVQNGEDARIRATPLQVLVDIDALKERAEGAGGEAAHPFIEVAEDDLGSLDALVVDESGQPGRLIPSFEHGGAEMDVVDVQRVAVDIEVGALTGARFAGP